MQTYEQWIAEHEPETIRVPQSQVVAAAAACRITLSPQEGRYSPDEVIASGVRVDYPDFRASWEGTTMTLRPQVTGLYGRSNLVERLREQLLADLTPPVVVLEMPEPTAQLPFGEWVALEGSDNNAYIASRRMFVSEARAALARHAVMSARALSPEPGRRYLLNSFSAQMLMGQLGSQGEAGVRFRLLDDAAARDWLAAGPWESRVGHESTVAIIAERIGVAVAVNRVGSTLLPGDTALIAQYVGPRLAEGATTLPDGARIEWLLAEAL